jgi:hypothetical protein
VTYLWPAFDSRFQSEVAKRIIVDILNTRLAKAKYDPEQIPELTKSISDEIMTAMKSKGLVRILDRSIRRTQVRAIQIHCGGDNWRIQRPRDKTGITMRLGHHYGHLGLGAFQKRKI